MKLRTINILATGLVLGSMTLFPSCVSKKKFVEAQDSIASLRNINKGLNDDLTSAQKRLKLMEEANASTVGELGEKESLLSQRMADLKEQEALNKKLQGIIESQRAKAEALKNKMSDALKSFNDEQLTVTTRNGKVYVSLQEKLLFPSGSAVVNKEGVDALGMLARALTDNPDININVEGHTDSIPIRIKFEDNWALSVARSTAIVRILTQDYGLAPERVIASGHSQFDPIADNADPALRAKNRRTEIILEPKLDQLYQLINDGL